MNTKKILANPYQYLQLLTNMAQMTGGNGFRQYSTKPNGGAKHRCFTFPMKCAAAATSLAENGPSLTQRLKKSIATWGMKVNKQGGA